MLVKQDLCRLNNTDSYYTVSCNFEIVECIIFIGKGIPPNKHANFCLYHYSFALNLHRVRIQVSDDVLLHPCFKRHFLNDG